MPPWKHSVLSYLLTVIYRNLFSVSFCKQAINSKVYCLVSWNFKKSIDFNNRKQMKTGKCWKLSLGCFRNRSGNEKHLIKLPPYFFQPPFVMEKWIVGIEEHQSVECVVTYEVSCKKQKLFIQDKTYMEGVEIASSGFVISYNQVSAACN